MKPSAAGVVTNHNTLVDSRCTTHEIEPIKYYWVGQRVRSRGHHPEYGQHYVITQCREATNPVEELKIDCISSDILRLYKFIFAKQKNKSWLRAGFQMDSSAKGQFWQGPGGEAQSLQPVDQLESCSEHWVNHYISLHIYIYTCMDVCMCV